MFKKPFISVTEYRSLLSTSEKREKSIETLRLLNEQYNGLIYQPAENHKIWIRTSKLLEIIPALAHRFQMNSIEYKALEARIQELEDELKLREF